MNHEKLYTPLQPGHIRLLQVQVPKSQADEYVISCSLSCIALTDIPNATSSKEESQDWYELSTAHWDYRRLFPGRFARRTVRRYLAEQKKRGEIITRTATVSNTGATQGGYSALSYVWGPSTQSKQIHLNGHLCPVTDNLYAALEQLQHCEAVKKGMRFWIDALCIDQADLKERAAQIQLMHQIYTLAQHIVIWLDSLTPSTELAFTAISWIAEQRYEGLQHSRPHQVYFPFVEYIIYPNTLPFRNSVMLGLWHLFSLPYWRRVWIVQEAALTSPKSPVMWGPFCISTRQLQLAAQYIDTHTGLSRAITYAMGNDVPEQSGGLRSVFTGDRSLQDRKTSPRRLWKLTLQVLRSSSSETDSIENLNSTLDVLRLTQLAECTDPRDKVFAILSTPALRLRVQMTSDYTCGLSQLFRLFSIHLFHNGDLNALRLVQAPIAPLHTTWQFQFKPWTISSRPGMRVIMHTPFLPIKNGLENWGTLKESLKGGRPSKIAVPACTHQLPSWVICLECPTAPVLPLPDSFEAGASVFIGVQSSTSVSGDILTANGVFIDTLTTLSAYNAREDSRDYPVNHPVNSSKTMDSYTNLEVVQEALCRTLLAGTMPDGSPVPHDTSLRYTLLDRYLWSGSKRALRPFSKGFDFEDFIHRNKKLRIDGLLLEEFLVPTNVKDSVYYEAETSDLITRATNVLAWRRLVVTEVGRLGLVPAHAQQNDRVVILQGCNVPLVVRKQENSWRLIGECYLHWVMRDEAYGSADWKNNIESIKIS